MLINGFKNFRGTVNRFFMIFVDIIEIYLSWELCFSIDNVGQTVSDILHILKHTDIITKLFV